MFSRKFSYYWRRRWKQLLLLIATCLVLGYALDNLISNRSAPGGRNSRISSSGGNGDGEQDERSQSQKAEESVSSTDTERRRRQLISDYEFSKRRLQSFTSVISLQQEQRNNERQLKKLQQSAAASVSNNSQDKAIASKAAADIARQQSQSQFSYEHCSMSTCFNFTKCYNKEGSNNFKIYIYPIDTVAATPISSTYQKILNSISSSSYFTQDPSQACLFVLSIDTLDRDELSRDYLRNMETRLNQLELWNNGENHVIFNLYAGTWPNYNETELGFAIGKAILAQASISSEQYRPNFDISIPLFHGTHSEKGEDEPNGLQGGVSTNFPDLKKHLISFKGKRYVYGIGSETRNSIYHLHNRKDVIMVTTCKHGKNWKDMKDERCDQDNIEYEKYDYETLLQNSTFCLVPRGRRLGSFRFLEVLRAGCIPVILSNSWILPFSEVIDWSQAAVIIDERNLLQTLEIVRSISHKRIFQLKQQTQILWNQYLMSVKKIIETTFEILRDRIHDYNWRDASVWNSSPGGLAYDLSFADNTNRFPFESSILKRNFTAVIYVHALSSSPSGNGGSVNKVKSASSNHYNSNVHLLRLVRTIGKSHFVSKILIVWDSTRPIPKTWPELQIPLTIKRNLSKSVMQRFVSTEEVETDAIFSLDEDTVISTDEIDFAYHVWSSFPDRIVGYTTRSHYWDEANETWRYSSKWTNDYSLVLNGGSMYHVYYNYVFNTKLPLSAQYLMESLHDCEDILLNILISQLNHCPPIKLIWKKMDLNTRSQWNSDHFYRQQTCLNELYDIYGTFPLKRSSVRFDPILYKDPVSNLRKKYRQVEV